MLHVFSKPVKSFFSTPKVWLAILVKFSTLTEDLFPTISEIFFKNRNAELRKWQFLKAVFFCELLSTYLH